MSKRNDSPRLFLVHRESIRPKASRRALEFLVQLAFDALAPLALVFIGIVCMAGYLAMNGNWEKAKDFLCIFLPPITTLMGVAAAAAFHPDHRE